MQNTAPLGVNDYFLTPYTATLTYRLGFGYKACGETARGGEDNALYLGYPKDNAHPSQPSTVFVAARDMLRSTPRFFSHRETLPL